MKLKQFIEQSNKVAGISETENYCGNSIKQIGETIFVNDKETVYASMEEAKSNIFAQIQMEEYQERLNNKPEDPNLHIIEAIEEFSGASNFEAVKEVKEKIHDKEFTGDVIIDTARINDKDDRVVEGKIDYVLKDGSKVAVGVNEIFKINACLQEREYYIDFMTESKDNFNKVLSIVEDHHSQQKLNDDIELGYRFHCYLAKIDWAVKNYISNLQFYKLDMQAEYTKNKIAPRTGLTHNYFEVNYAMQNFFKDAVRETKNSHSNLWKLHFKKNKKATKLLCGKFPLGDYSCSTMEGYEDSKINSFSKKVWSRWEAMRDNLMEIFNACNDLNETAFDVAVKKYENSFYSMKLLIVDIEKYLKENCPIKEQADVEPTDEWIKDHTANHSDGKLLFYTGKNANTRAHADLQKHLGTSVKKNPQGWGKKTKANHKKGSQDILYSTTDSTASLMKASRASKNSDMYDYDGKGKPKLLNPAKEQAVDEASFDPDVGFHTSLARKAKKLGDTSKSDKEAVSIFHDQDSPNHSKNAMDLVHKHEGVKSLNWEKSPGKEDSKGTTRHTASNDTHRYAITHKKSSKYTPAFTIITKNQKYKGNLEDKQDRKARLNSV